MKKTFRMEELECAHCAAKMEDAIRKLPGVENVSVSFLAQKLTLQAPDDQFEALAQQCAQICKKIEPDCVVVLK